MIKIHEDLLQGSEEWFAARLGLLTASEMKHIITPAKLQYSSSEKERSHLYEIAAQRISQFVEPSYVSDDMLRGQGDEIRAREKYRATYGEVKDVGFITNDKWGFTLGYSPDGLVGDDGLIEVKSRKQKFQIETILANEMPDDYKIQVQTGMMIAEKKWCDFISYSGGLPMLTKRVYADADVQQKILIAATTFHSKLGEMLQKYAEAAKSAQHRLVPTERTVEEEMV